MAVFRVERTRDYTVMSNHHLKNKDYCALIGYIHYEAPVEEQMNGGRSL